MGVPRVVGRGEERIIGAEAWFGVTMGQVDGFGRKGLPVGRQIPESLKVRLS